MTTAAPPEIINSKLDDTNPQMTAEISHEFITTQEWIEPNQMLTHRHPLRERLAKFGLLNCCRLAMVVKKNYLNDKPISRLRLIGTLIADKIKHPRCHWDVYRNGDDFTTILKKGGAQ